MNIIVELDASESATLQQQADENNAQPNRVVPSTPESLIEEELQAAAATFLQNLSVKFAPEDRRAIIVALDDPVKLAKVKAALR